MILKQSMFPKGWNKVPVNRGLEHYENQIEDEAVAEDEVAWEYKSHILKIRSCFCEAEESEKVNGLPESAAENIDAPLNRK